MATKMNESSIIMALNKRSKLMNESKTCKESADGKYVYTCPECGYEYHCDEEFGDDTTVKCPGCGAQITKECGGTKSTKKNESAPANPAGSNDEPDIYIMDQLYQCSECGDYFSSPVKFTGECTPKKPNGEYDFEYWVTGDGRHALAFYTADVERIGLQSVYMGGGVEKRSAIVYYDFTNGTSTSTGITSAKAATAGKVAYYDISGRRVNAPSKGLYIKQVIAADGSKKTVKIMK